MTRQQVLRAYGAYYVVTGIWPFVHLRSFLALTGPKNELWMLKTLSALIAAAGLALGRASASHEATGHAGTLAVGSSVALGGADTWYVARRRISPVYLVDAAAQAALAAAYLRGR